jgi:hypothetical protein
MYLDEGYKFDVVPLVGHFHPFLLLGEGADLHV